MPWLVFDPTAAKGGSNAILKEGTLRILLAFMSLALRRCSVDHLPRREAAGGRLGRTVQLQAEAAACSL
jgi:hypothetical protein